MFLQADLEEDDEEDADIEAIKAGSSIHDIAKLSTSEELKEVLDSIDRFTAERETRKGAYCWTAFNLHFFLRSGR